MKQEDAVLISKYLFIRRSTENSNLEMFRHTRGSCEFPESTYYKISEMLRNERTERGNKSERKYGVKETRGTREAQERTEAEEPQDPKEELASLQIKYPGVSSAPSRRTPSPASNRATSKWPLTFAAISGVAKWSRYHVS